MVDEGGTSSVMAGHGFYSAHSQPQHAAAAVAFGEVEQAARWVPIPPKGRPLKIGDFGCAGGRNEMQSMAIAIDGIRSRGGDVPIEVLHTDLAENDFGPLSTPRTPGGYPAGRRAVYPAVIGRMLYGPLVPDATLTFGWSGITLHWLSAVPIEVPDQVYPNFVTGAARDELANRSAQGWRRFWTNGLASSSTAVSSCS